MRPLMEAIKAAVFAAALLCAFANAAIAQSPTPTPTEEELRLQEQKRLLELQRDIEVAKKAIRDAQPQPSAAPTPPAPTATPLAGDTTLENVKLESEMVAYGAMSTAADRISDQVKRRIGNSTPTSPIPTLAIYDAQVVKDWRFYQALFPAFDGQVKDIFNRYTSLLCQKEGIKEQVSADFKTKFNCATGGLVLKSDREVMPQLAPLTNVIPSAFAAGTNLLKSFVDLTALFRTDTKITGNAFTIDESALVAEVFYALRNKYSETGPGINLYYPEVFPPRLAPPAKASPDEKYSRTVTTIGALFLAKIEADSVIAKLTKAKADLATGIAPTLTDLARLGTELGRIKSLTAELKNLESALRVETNPKIKERLEKEVADLSAELFKLRPQSVVEADIEAKKKGIEKPQEEIGKINANIESLTELNKRFQTFVDEFIKVDASGTNALALFIRSEDIENVMRGDNSYWLEIRSLSAGGNNRVRKNLIRYFAGAKLDHSGGVIIEYALYNKEGAVVFSEQVSRYAGYLEPKKIRKIVNGAKP